MRERDQGKLYYSIRTHEKNNTVFMLKETNGDLK